MELKGKTALITGAAQRLGGAIAEGLARQGCDIVIHYHLSKEQAQATAAGIEGLGVRVTTIQADLSVPEEARQLILTVRDRGFAPHFLINSAAVYPRIEWQDIQWHDLDSTLRINSFAPFVLSREFSKLPEATAVLNMLDARMVDYDARHLAYHLSKRTLHDLTRILAFELAPRILVNAIAPGIILPDRSDHPELLEKYRQGNLLKRIGSIDEIIRTVLFLLTSDFITGQVLYVDGGRHIRGRFYGS